MYNLELKYQFFKLPGCSLFGFCYEKIMWIKIYSLLIPSRSIGKIRRNIYASSVIQTKIKAIQLHIHSL